MEFNATPEQYEYMFNALIHNGMSSEPSHFSDNFTMSGHGIIAQVDYDRTKEEVLVHIVHKPFIISEAHIENGIQEAIDSMPTAGAVTANDAKEQTQ